MEEFDDKYKKKNPFSVPEDYFDTLEKRITDRITDGEKPQKEKFITMLKPYIGLVAIFLLALFVVQVILPHVVDPAKMLKRDGGEVVTASEAVTEIEELNTSFNPTSDEIIEYLASEVNDYELLFAEAN